MVLLVDKLGRSLKFQSNKSDALSASLTDFRSTISESIAAALPKPDPDSSGLVSLAGFNNCFELIRATNAAFAKLAVEIDYPMRRWGAALTDDYLSFTSHLLGLINAVTSSLSHLTHAKMSLLHALNTSARRLSRIAEATIPGERFKVERPIATGERHCSREELVLIHALALSEKIGLLALGFVVSGLCGDAKSYLGIRKIAGGVDDSVLKDLDSRFCKELMGLQGIVVEEVKEVNDLVDKCSESVEELKRRLKMMEKSIQGIDKQANNLFSQVLNARNKLLGNIRFPE